MYFIISFAHYENKSLSDMMARIQIPASIVTHLTGLENHLSILSLVLQNGDWVSTNILIRLQTEVIVRPLCKAGPVAWLVEGFCSKHEVLALLTGHADNQCGITSLSFQFSKSKGWRSRRSRPSSIT